MSAVVTLLAKERGGPRITYQVLLYPLVDYIARTTPRTAGSRTGRG